MKLLLVLLCLLLPLSALSQNLIIKDAQVLDVEKQKVLSGVSVRISDGKITAVGKYSKMNPSPEDSIIDASGKYLMPGLTDAHIHFFQSGGLYTRPDALDFREVYPYTEEIQFGKDNAADYLQRYLRLGITTVMDVGGPLYNFTVRDSIAAGMTAPNVLVTGPLFSMVSREKLDEGDAPIIKVDSKAAIDSLFDRMLPYRPDFIKVWYIASKEMPAEDNYPLVEYIGQRCRESNLQLAVHATQLNTAQLAVKAGATILVHSVDDAAIPADFIKMLKAKGVTYIPTLTVSKGYHRAFTGKINHTTQDLNHANPMAYTTLLDPERIDTSLWPPVLKRVYGMDFDWTVARDSVSKINLLALAKAGINIATGTDAGNIGTMHASSYLAELLAMQGAGLSNWQVLRYSTLNPAIGFGIADKTGSVSTGKQADLLLLDKNPLEDIQHLNAIALVIRSGEVLQPGSIVKESPEAVVQRQVNAYNARDIEAFLATYATDVEIYNEKGELSMQGHEKMREAYGPMFERITNLYCNIVNRMVINNRVVDHEHVRVFEQQVEAVAVYTVEGGKITRVDFVK